jgi:hypothetical protein
MTKRIKTTDGSIIHYLDGKMHNFDGPAYIPQGNKRAAEYYLFGVKYDYDKWLELSRPLRKATTKEDFVD